MYPRQLKFRVVLGNSVVRPFRPTYPPLSWVKRTRTIVLGVISWKRETCIKSAKQNPGLAKMFGHHTVETSFLERNNVVEAKCE